MKMRKNKLKVMLACTVMVFFTSHASALDFKGLSPEQEPPTPLTSPEWFCRPNPDAATNQTFCMKRSETIAGVKVIAVFVTLRHNKVESVLVSFSERDFDQVKAALIQKNGPPSSERDEVVQNRLGASFNSNKLVWKQDRASMSLTQRSRKLDESDLYLVGLDAVEQFQSDKKRSTQQNSADL
jgi:hypothetical protein